MNPIMSRARGLAERLKADTARLTQAWGAFEEQLRGLGFGVETEVPIVPSVDGVGALVWAKDGDKWVLLVSAGRSRRLLMNASRGIRIAAASSAVPLLASLVGMAEASLVDVARANAALGEAVDHAQAVADELLVEIRPEGR